MAKICPTCKGDKYIEEFDDRGLRKYTCRTCKGKGTIPEGKIRLEELSDCVRKGQPISFQEALEVIEYQSSKPKNKTLWQKVKSWIK